MRSSISWQRVHERQGLLALARGEPIYDALTLRLLRRANHIRPDGVATLSGKAAASLALHEEALWSLYRWLFPEAADGVEHQGVGQLSQTLPPDVIRDLEEKLSLQQVRA
jgi:manganese/zinc/iron transport system permease protein